MQTTFYVKAIWDAEASVWCSESDIPGLVLETATLAEFEAVLMELAPELLAENVGLHDQRVSFEFSASRRQELAVV